MKVIDKTQNSTYTELLIGDAFYTNEYGLCIKTERGAIGLGDGEFKKVDDETLIKQVKAEVNFTITS